MYANKAIPIADFDTSTSVKWEKWVIKKVMKEKKTAEGTTQTPVQVTAKVEVDGTTGELVEDFQKEMKLFKKHVFNIKTQNNAYKEIKSKLTENEIVVHGDFSENFSCKLTEEIQSFHFGASRKQVSLHTGILYTYDQKPVPFATISPSKDHGPPAIWAHLKPILEYVRKTYPNVTTVHFFQTGRRPNTSRKKIFTCFLQHYTKWGSRMEVGHFLSRPMEREPLTVLGAH